MPMALGINKTILWNRYGNVNQKPKLFLNHQAGQRWKSTQLLWGLGNSSLSFPERSGEPLPVAGSLCPDLLLKHSLGGRHESWVGHFPCLTFSTGRSIR